jgi:hypothetical protein
LLSKQNGCRKSTCKQIITAKIEEIKAHTIPLKAKEATKPPLTTAPFT